MPRTIIDDLIAKENWREAIAAIEVMQAEVRDPSGRLRLSRWIGAIPREAYADAGYLTKRIAIFGGYTTTFIALATKLELFRHRVFADLRESDYGMYEQDALAPPADLRKFEPDLAYFCVGTEHARPLDAKSDTDRWLALWRRAHGELGCEIISNTFEEPLHRPHGAFEHKYAGAELRFVRSLNAALAEAAPAYVHFADIDYLAGYHGRKRWRDEKFFDLSKVPVALEHLFDYAREVANVAAAIYGRAKKCLVLDLDNTLWGGVVGDDGVGGILIGEDAGAGEAFKRLQSYVKLLKERGIILAVCSKNDEANAKEPFTARTDMVLKLSDISCFVANWAPKHLNLVHIAETLSIGLDSMVFLDDNPAERELVRTNLPEVAVVDLPDDPAQYCAALDQSALFEAVRVTDDDRGRTAQYLANAARSDLEKSFTTPEDFLASLEMRALIAGFDPPNVPRIAQLINKTNQFNLTTRRYTEEQIGLFAADQSVLTRYVKIRDKFGDNGLISAFIARSRDDRVFEIDTWLMSCRVLKRGVEAFLFSDVVAELRTRGVRRLIGAYLPTAKNQMVEDLLPELGFVPIGSLPDGGMRYAFDLGEPATAPLSISGRCSIVRVAAQHY